METTSKTPFVNVKVTLRSLDPKISLPVEIILEQNWKRTETLANHRDLLKTVVLMNAIKLKLKQNHQCITRTTVIWQKAESLWQVHATPRLYSPDGSIWDWRFGCDLQLHVLAGARPQNLPFPCGVRDRHNTMCHWTPQLCVPNQAQMASKCECGRQTTDRQTDHATEKCVEIRGIACTARATANNNTSTLCNKVPNE